MTFTKGEKAQNLKVEGANVNVVLTGKETVILEDRPIPKCGPKDVLVQVMATGICGSDLSYYSKGGIGTTIVKSPLVLGHESCGVICEVGSEVNNLNVGDRVAIEPALPCRVCRACKAGRFNMCMNDTYMASPPTDGTLCQWYACPAVNAVPIPAALPWELSGSIQPLAIAVHVARRAGLRAHQTVAVFGCGPLGLLCMAVAKAYGAKKIVAIDVSESRLTFARQHYATSAYMPSRRPAEETDIVAWNAKVAAEINSDIGESSGLDVVIEASGAEPCMQLGLALLRHGGTYLQAGMGAPMSTVPFLQIATRELNVVGSLRYSTDCFEHAVDLLARGMVDLQPLVTKTFPLKDSEAAFKAVKAGSEIKIVIMNQQ